VLPNLPLLPPLPLPLLPLPPPPFMLPPGQGVLGGQMMQQLPAPAPTAQPTATPATNGGTQSSIAPASGTSLATGGTSPSSGDTPLLPAVAPPAPSALADTPVALPMEGTLRVPTTPAAGATVQDPGENLPASTAATTSEAVPEELTSMVPLDASSLDATEPPLLPEP
jgi:hypothetical protein